MKLSKKICMLGSPAVGKTSLVNQFVRSIFSDAYLTTIGARIDKKQLMVGGAELNLVIWDLAGEDRFESIRGTYLRGASGYLLVVDGCRRVTLEHAICMQEHLGPKLDGLPFVCVVNKSDLEDEWEVTESDMEHLASLGWTVKRSTARDGGSVEEVFRCLGEELLPGKAVCKAG